MLTDFVQQSSFFFKAPEQLDVDAVKPKWNGEKNDFFIEYSRQIAGIGNWELGELEITFKNLAAEKNIKAGELQAPLRIMLVGGKFGPPVFKIAELIGRQETISRIEKALLVFAN